MTSSLRHALSFVVIVALSACGGGGGGSLPAPMAGGPSGNAQSGNAFAASNVRIQEIAVPYQLGSVTLDQGETAALSVSPTGGVYFGEGGGNGTLTSLYSYSNGSFAQTLAAYNLCSKDVTICCGQSSQPCTGYGVTAVDAQNADPNNVFWSGETALEGVPDGLIFRGANGVKAGAPPAPYNTFAPVNASFFLSLLTDENGKLWDGGGGGYGAFGYPANLSSLPCTFVGRTNCWDALWFANGPNHHVWGFMHVALPSNQFGWPIPPSGTSGSIILEFDSSGNILHSYNISGFIGGIASGLDGGLWFTNLTTNAVERISGSGNITQYGIPTANSGAATIALAADGAHWFIEGNTNKVARVDTSGHFVEFALPSPNAGAVAIGADPPGGACSPNVIWVLEANVAKLAKISY